MTETKLKAYKLLIVPGGNSDTIANNLSKAARAMVRATVQNDGLHYLGICAGGFFGSYQYDNGLDLTSGVWFNVWPNNGKGTVMEAVEISFPKSSKLDMYWHDGPETSGWGYTPSTPTERQPSRRELTEKDRDPVRRTSGGTRKLENLLHLYDTTCHRPRLCRYLGDGGPQWDVVASLLKSL